VFSSDALKINPAGVEAIEHLDAGPGPVWRHPLLLKQRRPIFAGNWFGDGMFIQVD